MLRWWNAKYRRLILISILFKCTFCYLLVEHDSLKKQPVSKKAIFVFGLIGSTVASAARLCCLRTVLLWNCSLKLGGLCMSRIVIIGTGETGEIAHEYFTYDSEHEVVAFSVERAYLQGETLHGLPVVPLEELEQHFPPQEYLAFVAISSTKLNRVRTRLYRLLKERGYRFASYLSSRAFVWRNVEIGENCFIFENNTIQPFVTIGNNCVLWSGNHIGHNTVIHDNCFIASQVVISGFCEIGENCFLGVNSTVINNIAVAKDCFIGAGVLIQKNTEEGKVYQAASAEASKVGSLRLFKIKEP